MWFPKQGGEEVLVSPSYDGMGDPRKEEVSSLRFESREVSAVLFSLRETGKYYSCLLGP